MTWINVKEQLPPNDTHVKVQIFLLWRTQARALYVNKYFVRKGEDITPWVTHWKLLSEEPK